MPMDGRAAVEALEDTCLVDVHDDDKEARTGAYVILDEGVTLVDPGSSRGVGYLEEGLKALGVTWHDVRHIFATHVHLDHAGGVGTIAALAERETVHCHPRGARHLADPERLVRGSRAVFGERMDVVFGSVVPVPSWRIEPAEDLARISTGRHTLVALDSPGHARHHATYLDERTGALFTGDAVGVRYDPAATGCPQPYIMPTTSPSEFDPVVSLATLDRLRTLGAVAVCHTHFAASPPADAFAEVAAGLEAYLSLAERYGDRAGDADELRKVLLDWHLEDLERNHISDADPDLLRDDLYLNALGLFDWWQRESARRAEETRP
jgi:glyoxylase-like metal-dependent hydrolase (beta-lactamase superfamily II)